METVTVILYPSEVNPMDESPFGLICEVEIQFRQNRDDSSPIRRWEARFRERLERTLSRLREANLSSEKNASQ